MADSIEAQRPLRELYINNGLNSILTPPINIKAVPPITANQLLGETLDEEKRGKLDPPYQNDLDGFSIANSPIHFYQLSGQIPGIEEFLGFMAYKLTGERLNQLLLSIAAHKNGFGLDPYDNIADWGENADSSFYFSTMEKHAKGLGVVWDIVSRDRHFFAQQEKTWYDAGQPANWKPKKKPSLIPTFRWESITLDDPSSEQRRWHTGFLTREPHRSLRVQFANTYQPGVYPDWDPRWCHPVPGIFAAAHFTPEVVAEWEKRKSGKYSPDGRTRAIGTTQAFGYALDKSYEPLYGRFITKAQNYIRSSPSY